MNIVEGALFTFLQTNSVIAGYVGGAGHSPPTTPRIYPLVLRQDGLLLPALTYHAVSGHSELSIDGVGNKKGWRRIQISAWSNARLEAETILEALRVLLNGYIGLWDDIYVSVTSFSYVPMAFDITSKISHASAQITLFFDEP